MSELARDAAVAALLDLSRSADYRDRADAGRCLAWFAERPEAGARLHELVVDAEDTFVTAVTTEALLRRGDEAGLAAVAVGLAYAAEDHERWIETAAREVFGVFARERDAAVGVCEMLERDAGRDADVRAGAARLATVLRAFEPTFQPKEHGGPG